MSDVQRLTHAEAESLLDTQARRYCGMGGEEFVRRYRAGELEDTLAVARVAMLLPLQRDGEAMRPEGV